MTFGQAALETMIDDGLLEEVDVDIQGAEKLINDAKTHHESAALLADRDPATAMDALHAGNRKALDAVLLARGLRSTKDGGHVASGRAVAATLGSNKPVAVYNVVRQMRHLGDYQGASYSVDPDHVKDNLSDSGKMVESCEKAIHAVPVFAYGS